MSETAMPRAPAKEGWRHFAHGADLGVMGEGKTVEEAFARGALALTRAVTDAEVAPKLHVAVACEAEDIELLFVEWLNAIIYEMAVRQMLFSRFAVKIDRKRLTGDLWGEPIDPARHAPACEPKGATYTALRVGQDPDGMWRAACVVDV
jgi:tRNA nucleotidyltransferase (CCA-adding enzyme)